METAGKRLSKAAEDCRSPQAGAPSNGYVLREASWSAAVLCRFAARPWSPVRWQVSSSCQSFLTSAATTWWGSSFFRSDRCSIRRSGVAHRKSRPTPCASTIIVNARFLAISPGQKYRSGPITRLPDLWSARRAPARESTFIVLGHSYIPSSHSAGMPSGPTEAPASAPTMAPTVSVSPPPSSADSSACRKSPGCRAQAYNATGTE